MRAVRYCEIAPAAPLRGVVDAFFCFAAGAPAPSGARRVTRSASFASADEICPALFADARASIVFDFSGSWRVDGLWRPGAEPGFAIGAMTRGRASAFSPRVHAIGAYLRPGRIAAMTGVPARELTDRIVPLAELWRDARELGERLTDARDDALRVDLLEATLLARAARVPTPHALLDLPALAGLVERSGGALPIGRLASGAGVSRQHLARRFRDELGMSPKTASRLARFRRVLAAARPESWAQLARDAGYADQSHLIAEFREFTGQTPRALRSADSFHPFL